MLDAFLFARETLLKRINTNEKNLKQNKVHDEQITVANLRQKKFNG